MTATFPYLCDKAPDPALEPARLRTRFGDGYEQRAGAGINTLLPSWNLSFSKRSQAEAQAIAGWLAYNQAHLIPFYWDPTWADNTANGESLGVTDNYRNQFQLTKNGFPVCRDINATILRTDWQGTYALSPNPRTNLCPQSELASGWTQAAGILAFEPSRLIDTSTSSQHALQRGISGLTIGTTYTLSLQMAPGTANFGYIQLGSTYLLVNLTTGTLDAGGGPGAASYQIKRLPDGSLRVSIQRVAAATTETIIFGLYVTSGVVSYVGSGSYILIGKAQLEVGSVATPYMANPSSSPLTVTDYTINGSGLVTLANTTNPVVGQNLGTANGSTAAFTITTPNGSTPTVTGVWRTDWQGRQRMYSTARTNLHIYSETFSAWTADGTCTKTIGQTGPDGGTTAVLLNGVDVATNFYYSVTGGIGTNGTRYEPSFWMKRVSTAGVASVSNIISPTAGNWRIDLSILSNGWEKITRSHPAVTVVTEFTALSSTCGCNFGKYSGTGTLSFYVDKVKLEPGTVSTPYFAAGATAVTVTDYTVSSFTVTFATNPLAGAVIEADYTYVGAPPASVGLAWSGTGKTNFKWIADKWTPARPDDINSWSVTTTFRQVPA